MDHIPESAREATVREITETSDSDTLENNYEEVKDPSRAKMNVNFAINVKKTEDSVM